ncbi:MAG: phosphoenolpyruvate synthase, partial [candidate division Zixibacteria bacterium]|nr:phosphoenolpyruvate synthase [candidate division Zixibacteria bacterium]
MPDKALPDSKLSHLSQYVEFHELMRYRIRDILLVSSLYDAFLLSEEGGLYEKLLNEYVGLNLSHTPGIKRVSSADAALDMLSEQHRFDLIIVTPHLGGQQALDFAGRL